MACESLSLTVNGSLVSLSVAETTPLMYVLRNDLGLTSVRFGCGEGECGACAVLIDGRRALSCDVQLAAAAGSRVVTLEGLLEGDVPDPLVRAFLDEQAGQCGYCLPGIVVTARALLDECPGAGRAQIAAALDGNLCRCGAHPRVLRAIERVARA